MPPVCAGFQCRLKEQPLHLAGVGAALLVGAAAATPGVVDIASRQTREVAGTDLLLSQHWRAVPSGGQTHAGLQARHPAPGQALALPKMLMLFAEAGPAVGQESESEGGQVSGHIGSLRKDPVRDYVGRWDWLQRLSISHFVLNPIVACSGNLPAPLALIAGGERVRREWGLGRAQSQFWALRSLWTRDLALAVLAARQDVPSA